MIWAAPGLLWLLPLAAAPVAVHLFLKPRRTAVAFPSLLFLLGAEPRREGRRRLIEILLLILRCLVLIALVLLLAGPQLPGVAGGGGGVLAVVVDTSASMGGQGADGRPLARSAGEIAAAVIQAVPAGTRVVVVPTVPDPAQPLPPGASADRAALAEAAGRIAASDGAGRITDALGRACAVLAAASTADRRLVVITDGQDLDREEGLPERPTGCAVLLARLAPAPVAGVDVVAARATSLRAIAGRPARATVTLANRDATEATVHLTINRPGEAATVHDVRVPPGGETVHAIVLHPSTPGPAWAMASIDGTGRARRAAVAVEAGGRATVVVVGDAGLLPTMLAPDGTGDLSGLAPRAVQPADLAAALANQPACLVITWDALAGIAEAPLRGWVAAGGTLLLLPSPNAAGVPQVPTWIGLGVSAEARPSPPSGVVVTDAGAACFDDCRDGGTVQADLAVQRAWIITGGNPALALADGRPVLCERTLGRGLIVGCGLAMAPAWSDLPLKGWSLALVQALALRTGTTRPPVRLTAGDALPPAVVAASGPGPYRLLALDGASLDWQGPAPVPGPARAGIYRLEGGAAAHLLAVSAAGDEGRRAGPGRLLEPWSPTTVSGDPAAVVSALRRLASGLDLRPWLAVLLVAAWLGEGLLASGRLPGRRPA